MSFPEIVANALCLELVNTVNSWPEPRYDVLATASSTAAWAELAGVPVTNPPSAAERARAASLREILRSVFAPLAHGDGPDPEALAALAQVHRTALGRARLTAAPSCYRYSWPSPGHFDDALGQAAQSAVDLLATAPLDRIGECPSCGWLFLDTSRNGRRRWCNMATCGARAKARAHYNNRRGR